jgi:predicted amidohydrolase YtcJ
MNASRLTVARAWAILTLCAPPAFSAVDPCSWSRDLRFINGKIHTMDSRNSVVAEVTVRDGHFAVIGPGAKAAIGPCTKTIDLRGRTVVPGLIDNHNHFVSLGLRPGYDVRLETAFSISSILDRIRERIKTAPAGAFITATAGWSINQLDEKRIPTMAELDQAAPANPVFMYPTGQGGGVVNHLAKTFFEGKQIKINADGTLPGGGISGSTVGDAIGAMRTVQTFEDEKRGAIEAMTYSVSLGLTTNVDQGFNFLRGTPDLKDSQTGGPGIESFSPWTVYDSFIALNREDKLLSRLRIFLYSVDTEMDTPILREHLLNNAPFSGDDMLRLAGVGERAVSWAAPAPARGGGAAPVRTAPPNLLASLQFVAAQGWPFSQHSTSLNEDQIMTDAYEKVNAVTPIAGLHWSIGHVPKIDVPTLNRLKAIGVGVEPHAWVYLNGRAGAGPPFRTILETGIHAGGGSDAVGVAPLDPWLMIYYMVTGKNAAGELINQGQQLTRDEALRLYTANNGWFFKEEDKLGSIEPGKLADLVVLSGDYFDPGKVADKDIRLVKSVLTVVGGRIVYNTLN